MSFSASLPENGLEYFVQDDECSFTRTLFLEY